MIQRYLLWMIASLSGTERAGMSGTAAVTEWIEVSFSG